MLRLLPVPLLLLITGMSGRSQPPAEEKAAQSPAKLPAAAPAEPIRSTAELRKMTFDQLEPRPRVDIEGIILDVPWKGFPGANAINPQIYQDGVAIFVSLQQALKDKVVESVDPWLRMEPGDRVRIRGTARAGNFSPLIVPDSMEFLGRVPLPEAETITGADLATGEYDGQWVSVTGVVQAIREPETEGLYSTPFHMLQIGSPHGNFRARVPSGYPSSLGSQVRVRGVCLPYLNLRGEVVGLLLHLNGPEEITVLRPGPRDPFDAKEISPKAMRPFDPENGLDSSRRLLEGVVTSVEPGSHLYLQKDKRGGKVGLAEGQSAEVGDLIQASGFVRTVDGFAELDFSLIRKMGIAPLPTPVPITSDLLREEFKHQIPTPPDAHCGLVSLKGTLIKEDIDPDGKRTLWVESEGITPRSFPVTVRKGLELSLPRPGSLVEIVGVCELVVAKLDRLVSFARPSDLKMFLSRAEDLHVRKSASWWTPAHLSMLVGGIALVLVPAMLQVRSWRRSVRESSVALAAAVVSQRAAEVRAEERERFAEEIHDIMAQSLTGVALQMNAADMSREAAPAKVSKHLKLAAGLLNFARDEIRRTLLNLRSGLLDNSDFSGSLKPLVEMFSKTGACEIDRQIIGTPQPLHPLTAHSLLRVIPETMTNSVRHGKATRIEVQLEYTDTGILLSIKDNGMGKVSPQRRGPAEGHFGLESMRGRVRRLAGDFRFTSIASEGATVEASIPLQPAPSAFASEPPLPALRPPSRRITGTLPVNRHD